MENIILTFIVRGLGVTLAAAGIYLLMETTRNIPELMYLFTPIFGTMALMFGVFAVIWDGWKF